MSGPPQAKKLKPAPHSATSTEFNLTNDTLIKIQVQPRKGGAKTHIHLESSQNLLQDLLFPLPTDLFFEQILHQKAVAICGNGAKHTAEFTSKYFSGADVSTLLETTASESISLWLPSNSDSRALVDSFKTADVALAQRLFETNQASLYFRASQETCDALTKQVLTGLDWPLGVDGDGETRGEVEVFLGNARNATPKHTDFQHNFTVQLAGSKTWSFKRGDVTNPLAAKSTHFANTPDAAKEHQLLSSSVCGGATDLNSPDDDDDGWESVTLCAGDVMYHPPGMWHRVCTSSQEEHSLSCNISLISPTWADVVSSAVRQLLWKQALFRQPVSARDYLKVKEALLGNGKIPAVVAESLAVLDSPNRETDLEWEGSERTLGGTRYHIKDTVFECNALAVVLFDSDAFAEEGDEEEELVNCIVSINIGASTHSAVDAMLRFQVQDIPRALLPLLLHIRNKHSTGEKTKWTGKELVQMSKQLNIPPHVFNWECFADMLTRCAWWSTTTAAL